LIEAGGDGYSKRQSCDVVELYMHRLSSIWNRHGGVEALLTNQETGIFSHIGVSDSTSIPNLLFFISSMTVSEYYLCLTVLMA
jgi:hypothetical protein